MLRPQPALQLPCQTYPLEVLTTWHVRVSCTKPVLHLSLEPVSCTTRDPARLDLTGSSSD